MLNLALFIAAVFAAGQWFRSRDVLKRCEEFEKQLKEHPVSDFDLYESEIEELYRKPESAKVELRLDEAKLILEALLRLPVEGNKAILKKTLIPLKEKIEKAEKCK
jgi:hypothetical protein